MPSGSVDLFAGGSSLLYQINQDREKRQRQASLDASGQPKVLNYFRGSNYSTTGRTSGPTIFKSGYGEATTSGSGAFGLTTQTTQTGYYLDYNIYGQFQDEPNRLQRPSDVIRGSFGAAYIRFDNTETYPYADGYQITADNAIIYNEGEDVPYGVIRVDLREGPDNLSTLVSRSSELVAFVSAGGVLWITSEFVVGFGPGTDANVVNPVLSSIYNLSMTYNNDFYDAPNNEVQVNTLLYGQAATTLPAIFLTDATRTVNGGTPLYGSNGKIVAAFEPLGAGYVVLTGDSNGTAQDPDVDSEDSWVYSLRRFNLV